MVRREVESASIRDLASSLWWMLANPICNWIVGYRR